jgi:hypothetical protein
MGHLLGFAALSDRYDLVSRASEQGRLLGYKATPVPLCISLQTLHLLNHSESA